MITSSTGYSMEVNSHLCTLQFFCRYIHSNIGGILFLLLCLLSISFFHLPFIFPHIIPSFAMPDGVRAVLCYFIFFLHPPRRHPPVPDLRKGVGQAVVPLGTACGLGRECPHCSAVAGEGDGRGSAYIVHHREKEDVSVLIGYGE